MQLLMQRAVLGLFPALVLDIHLIACLRRAETIDKPLPNILYSQRRWMHQVICIKAIVTQLVHEDLINRQVGTRLRIAMTKTINGK